MNPCRKHEAQDVHESGAGYLCRICEIERLSAEYSALIALLGEYRRSPGFTTGDMAGRAIPHAAKIIDILNEHPNAHEFHWDRNNDDICALCGRAITDHVSGRQ